MSDPELEARLLALERRQRQLDYNQRALDVHLAALENSVIFRILQHVGRPLIDARTKAARWLMGTPLRGISRRLSPPGPDPYQAWMEQEAEGGLPPLTASPRFSILMALVKPRLEEVEATIASVLAQSYPNWELCIHTDDSCELRVREFLVKAARSEPRIHLAEAGGAKPGVSVPWKQAATLATGDYIAVLGESDSLAPDALHWMASGAPADVIYSDEDRFEDGGRRSDPVFKPDWSPDLLLSCMYFGHLTAYSRSAFEGSGGFRPEYCDAQAYDLALRITDGEASVRHVPRILYHSRRDDSGTPDRGHAAGRQALGDALRRRGLSGEVDDGPHPNSYKIRWKPSGTALASLIICSRSPRLLEGCLRTLATCTAYPHREIIVVQHLGADDVELEGVIARHGALRVPYTGPFHFSRMNSLGVQAAKGEVLVFLNDDTEPIESSWLERLVAQVERPGVGIAGAQLLYPSGSLQHGGVVIGIGDGCGHVGRGGYGSRFWPWIELTRDVTAVTGACLAIRAPLFRDLGGFADEFPVNYNDVDLCLRVRAAGLRVVYEAGAKLRHYECQTRRGVVTFDERERWYSRWGELIDAGDPFYSPYLTSEREDLSLRRVTGAN